MSEEPPQDKGVQLAQVEAGRLKSWLTFWGVVVGTALVGIVTAVINWQIEDSKTKIRASEVEQHYLEQFADRALGQNIQQRVDFADYVASVAVDQEFRDLWAAYREKLKRLLPETREELVARIQELERLQEDESKTNSAKIQELELTIRSLREQLQPSRTKFGALPDMFKSSKPKSLKYTCQRIPASLALSEPNSVSVIETSSECVFYVNGATEETGQIAACRFRSVRAVVPNGIEFLVFSDPEMCYIILS